MNTILVENVYTLYVIENNHKKKFFNEFKKSRISFKEKKIIDNS